MDDQLDISSITFEDLLEEYLKLKERFAQLSIINEQDTQRIYELRRNLETSAAAEAYLTQELEQLSSVQLSQDDALLHKKQNEIDDLKKRQGALLTENEELHQDIADLRAENAELMHKIKELTLASEPAEILYKIPKEHLEFKERLETENLELLAKLDESHENVVKFTMSLAEKEKYIEILNDQVLCLKENFQSKREELEEKSHLLESAQEQIVEMNAKIAMLTSAPDNADRKGNSLFAEVDDQRQAMKQLLATQKKGYQHMKKVYDESQHEIRRLKRQNVAMHNELQACSSIFCSADKTYKEKLNERISQLLKQNEDLEKKLAFTQQELISMANDKGVVWLDSMLLFCKQETEELKKQLHGNRIQMGILEERLRNSQQDLAKWRFEALKTRCILIDRESLLTDNNIEFKMFTNKDVAFSSIEMESARPKIVYEHPDTQISHKDETCQDSMNKSTNTDETVSSQEHHTAKINVDLMEENKKSFYSTNSKQNAEINDIRQGGLQNDTIVIEDDECRYIKEERIADTILRVKKEKCETIEVPAIKPENCDAQTEANEGKKSIDFYENPDEIIKNEQQQKYQKDTTTKNKEINSELSDEVSLNPLRLDSNSLWNELNENENENKENINNLPFEANKLPTFCAKNFFFESKVNPSSEFVEDLKPIPSILVKKRNILDDNTKTVHFAETETFKVSDQFAKQKFTCKSTRTKSNVIVKRILVNSRIKKETSEPNIP